MENGAWTVPSERPRLHSAKQCWWAKGISLGCGRSVIDAAAPASLLTNLLLQQLWGLSLGCANKWSTSCGNGSKWKGLGGKHRLWNRLFSPEVSYCECKNKGLCKRDHSDLIRIRGSPVLLEADEMVFVTISFSYGVEGRLKDEGE